MKRINWNQLGYFRAVAQFQHVTRAAAHLGVSQPALSRAVASLEAELGVALFEHRRPTISLTPSGERFLEHVERAFAAIEDGFRELDVPSQPDRGFITVGFLRTLGYGIVPRLVGSFRALYPDAEVALVQKNGVELEEELKEGRMDLAFIARPEDTALLRWTKLATQELVLIVPSSHRWATRDAISLEEAKQEPFICFTHGHGFRDLADRVLHAVGIEPRIGAECDDGSYLIGFVAAGLGVALMPPGHTRAAGIQTIKLINPEARREIGIAWANHRHLNRSAHRFCALARSSIHPDLVLP